VTRIRNGKQNNVTQWFGRGGVARTEALLKVNKKRGKEMNGLEKSSGAGVIAGVSTKPFHHPLSGQRTLQGKKENNKGGALLLLQGKE